MSDIDYSPSPCSNSSYMTQGWADNLEQFKQLPASIHFRNRSALELPQKFRFV